MLASSTCDLLTLHRSFVLSNRGSGRIECRSARFAGGVQPCELTRRDAARIDKFSLACDSSSISASPRFGSSNIGLCTFDRCLMLQQFALRATKRQFRASSATSRATT
jgi:hypothetical protein